MKLRVAGIVEDSIVDGPGLRLTVFAQGCGRHCPGCHNPDTWDYSAGMETTTEKILEMMAANPLLDGLSLSGGEPFDQAAAFGAELLSKKAGAEFPNGYLFVTMGAGDNWKVAQKIMAAGFLEGEK